MIDIIIPTYGQEDFTVKCVESIRRHTPQFHRIIWVDNGSTGDSRKKVLKALEGSRYLSIWLPRNLGFVKAVNIGLREVTGEFVVLQNNDTEATEYWMERLLEPHNDPSVGATGPITDTEHSWQGWRNIKDRLYNQLPELHAIPKAELSKTAWEVLKGVTRPVQMIAFFSTLFKTEVFNRVGLLDEQFGTGLGDDDDYSRRMIQAGYKILFVPGAFVHHHHRTTFKSLYDSNEISEMQRVNMDKFKMKHGLKK